MFHLVAKETGRGARRLPSENVLLAVVVVVAVLAAGWVMITVSSASQLPSSEFVTLPATPLSEQGQKVKFDSVSPISQGGISVGVRGFLKTADGRPVAGATIYFTYYLQGAYRTQATVTDQDGYFEVRFPMNWTGWLPVTLTYYGDDAHQGISEVFSI